MNSLGDIIVLDIGAKQLLRFNKQGVRLSTAGRPGTGPGEFSSPTAVMIGAADSILVLDIAALHVNVYSSVGAFARSFRFSLQDGAPVRWDVLPTGELVQQVRSVATNQSGATAAQGVIRTLLRDGNAHRNLVPLPGTGVLDLRRGIGAVRTRMFYPETVWDADEYGRLLVAESSTYRFHVHTAQGSLRAVVDAAGPVRKISESEREEIAAVFRSTVEQGLAKADSEAARVIRQTATTLDIASQYPAFTEIRAGPDRTILLRHQETVQGLRGRDPVLTLSHLQRGSARWDVFAEDGRYLGQLTFPATFRLLATASDYFYGTLADDDDVVTVVRIAAR